MCLCQVGYVDIVTNACPIGCLVVGSEDRDGLAVSAGGIENEWHQMRFGIVVRADLDIWIRSGRIEIAQRYGPQSVSRMEIGEHTLDHKLRGAIRIDRGLWQLLVDRD